MLKKLLITGATGNLGAVCRERLKPIAETIRLSDRPGADMGQAAPHEELVPCDLGDKAAVEALVEGCDGIVHMVSQSVEANWETVRNANIDGVFHLYEGARKSSVTPRIIFASSNHAIGFYKQTALFRKVRVGDSSRESSVVAGLHEQTHPAELQDQELAGLQRGAEAAWLPDDLV